MAEAICPHCGGEFSLVAAASKEQRSQGRPTALYPQLEDRRWLTDRYETRSARRIASEIGCNEKTVNRWLAVHGIKTHPRGWHLVRDRQQTPDREPLRDKTWLVAKHEEMSAEAIAAELGCDGKTVRKWLVHHGIKTHPAGWQPPGSSPRRAPRVAKLNDKEWLEARYQEFSLNAIASELGVDSKTVGKWMDRHGIPRRPLGWHRSKPEDKEARRAVAAKLLREWAAENGGDPPTQEYWSAFRPEGAPHTRTICSLFGDWTHAIRAAGLRPRKSGEVTRRYQASAAPKKPGRNRQMVTGKGFADTLPGATKHYEAGSGRKLG